VSFADGLLVAGAGLVAGAVNAVAGGGTLISFPALIAAGNSPLVANITSSVGLISGYLGGSMAYRSELAGQRDRVRALGLVSILGGITGAAILLATPSHTFDAVVPWLVLTAALLLFAQPRLAGVVAARRERRPAGASGDRGVGAAPPPRRPVTGSRRASTSGCSSAPSTGPTSAPAWGCCCSAYWASCSPTGCSG
jgi:uncharacterized membrane protein YfcA